MHASRSPWLVGLALLALAACNSLGRSDSRIGWGLGDLRNNEQWGPWTYWYQSGGKMAAGSYYDDHQTGRWTYWFEDGQVEWQGGFDDSRMCGPSVFFWETGTLRAHGGFRDGLEEGLWGFTSREGKLERRGQFVRGRQALRWTQWYPDGAMRAEGYFLDGIKVGLWQFWDETGALFEHRYDLPPNVELACDAWPTGGLRREGFLIGGRPTGRWLTWHENGEPRIAVDVDGGVPHGACLAWNEAGDLIASVGFAHGRPIGGWFTFRGAEPKFEDTPASFAIAPSGGAWSPGSLANSRGALGALSTWLGEALGPPPPAIDQTPQAGALAPSAELVAAVDEPVIVPLRAQPFTKRENESVEYLRARYQDGAKSVKPPPGNRRYGQRGKTETPKGDTARAAKLVGKPLPLTEFRDELGRPFDVGSYRGSKYVCLVVMRGFAREVCIYCVTQTEALADSKAKFDALGAEVLVLYPGERNRLLAFVESIERESGGRQLPLRLLYDPDLALAKALDIESEFAIPTTLVLDQQGIVRYAYVGTTVDDRPATSDVLAVIGALGKP